MTTLVHPPGEPDLLDFLEALANEPLPPAPEDRRAIEAAVERCIDEHDGLVHIAWVRPHIDRWVWTVSTPTTPALARTTPSPRASGAPDLRSPRERPQDGRGRSRSEHPRRRQSACSSAAEIRRPTACAVPPDRCASDRTTSRSTASASAPKTRGREHDPARDDDTERPHHPHELRRLPSRRHARPASASSAPSPCSSSHSSCSAS